MKLLSYAAVLLFSLMLSSFTNADVQPVGFTFINTEKKNIVKTDNANALIGKLNAAGLSEQVFDIAKKGYHYLLTKNKLFKTNILTVIDFSKPSNQKRMYIIDMAKSLLLNSTLVAHGKNSGTVYATDFSNEADSYKSSLGFYTTKETYIGANGYSLKLQGIEKGFNDNAASRAIVLHGADYVSDEHIKNAGYLGRSYGCPAVPMNVSKTIINKIKGGSCLFVYSPSKKYLTTSKILNS